MHIRFSLHPSSNVPSAASLDAIHHGSLTDRSYRPGPPLIPCVFTTQELCVDDLG